MADSKGGTFSLSITTIPTLSYRGKIGRLFRIRGIPPVVTTTITSPIPFDADAADIREALRQLGCGDHDVQEDESGTITITFGRR